MDMKLLQEMEISPETYSREKIKMYQGVGCESCKFTGFRGRTAIYEIIVIDGELRDMIAHSANAAEIKRHAIGKGMHTLRQDGWEKVLQGITTPGEVLRVVATEGR